HDHADQYADNDRAEKRSEITGTRDHEGQVWWNQKEIKSKRSNDRRENGRQQASPPRNKDNGKQEKHGEDRNGNKRFNKPSYTGYQDNECEAEQVVVHWSHRAQEVKVDDVFRGESLAADHVHFDGSAVMDELVVYRSKNEFLPPRAERLSDDDPGEVMPAGIIDHR